MVKIAAILARVSREVQETESQISSLRKDAEYFGYQVPSDCIFSEKITGMDSFDRDERESLQNLKAEIENKHRVKAIFMWELTRLSRNPYYLIDQLRWFNLKKIPIYFHDMDKWTMDRNTLNENLDTTNSIFGAATYGQQEWEKIRKRTMRGRELKAQKGLYVGHISDGYKVVLIGKDKHFAIDEERAPIIQRIFQLYTESNYTTYQIASLLNGEAIPTYNAWEAIKNKDNQNFNQFYKKKGTNLKLEKTKGEWLAETISNILKNRWYIGERSYKGIVYNIEPIVSTEQFDKANEKLNFNKKKLPKRRVKVYCLSNLLFCGKCGRPMHGHKVRINSSYYCSSIDSGQKCGAEGICKENIEAIVWQLISWNIWMNMKSNNAYSLFKIEQDDIDHLNMKISNNKLLIKQKKEDIQMASKGLKDLLKRNVIEKNSIVKNATDSVILDLKKEIEKKGKEILELEGEIVTLENRTHTNESVGELLANLSVKKDINSINEIIHAVVDKIYLYNLEDYFKLIVVKYKSLKESAAIYNSRLLKGKFVNLDVLWRSGQVIFDGNHLICKPALIIFNNVLEQYRVFNELPKDYIRLINKVLVNYVFRGVIYGRSIIDNMKDCIMEYSRIEEEPKDEEYKKWKADYKKWSAERSKRRKEKLINKIN